MLRKCLLNKGVDGERGGGRRRKEGREDQSMENMSCEAVGTEHLFSKRYHSFVNQSGSVTQSHHLKSFSVNMYPSPGLPQWLSGTESTCQCRRCRFNPWLRKIPRRRKWQPTPVFLPRKSHGQRSLEGYSPWGLKESDTTQQLKQQTTFTPPSTPMHRLLLSLGSPLRSIRSLSLDGKTKQ